MLNHRFYVKVLFTDEEILAAYKGCEDCFIEDSDHDEAEIDCEDSCGLQYINRIQYKENPVEEDENE